MKLDTITLRAFVLGLALTAAAPAAAGPYTDELAKCLVRSTSEADKNELMRWMFAAMASHPQVREMAAVPAAERDRLSAGTAALFERLLTVSCRSQAEAAFRYEGQGTIEASFSTLGSVAARGLMAHPDVATFTAKLDEHLDDAKLKEVLGP